MEEPIAPARKRRRNFFRWLLVVWLIGWLGMILEQTISWSDPLHGLYNGLLAGGMVSPFLLIYTVPLGTLGWFLGVLRPLSRNRRAISFLFAAALPFYFVGTRVVERINPGKRFEQLTGVSLPAGVRIEKTTFSGGLLADLNQQYVLTCSAEDTTKLIQDLNLKPDESGRGRIGGEAPVGSKVAGGDWEVHENWIYCEDSGDKSGKTRLPDFLQLQTDETRTKVRIVGMTI